jgi:hypothetical protein
MVPFVFPAVRSTYSPSFKNTESGSVRPHPEGGVEVVTHSETAATEPDRAA